MCLCLPGDPTGQLGLDLCLPTGLEHLGVQQALCMSKTSAQQQLQQQQQQLTVRVLVQEAEKEMSVALSGVWVLQGRLRHGCL